MVTSISGPVHCVSIWCRHHQLSSSSWEIGSKFCLREEFSGGQLCWSWWAQACGWWPWPLPTGWSTWQGWSQETPVTWCGDTLGSGGSVTWCRPRPQSLGSGGSAGTPSMSRQLWSGNKKKQFSINIFNINLCIQVWVVIGRSCSDTNISSHCVLLVFHQPSQVHLQENSSISSSSDCSQCPGHHPASGWRSQDHYDCPGGQGRCPTLWLQLPPGLVQFPNQYICCSHISVGKQKEKVTRQWQCKLYPSEVGH